MNRSFIILIFAFLSLTLAYSIRAKTQELNIKPINESYQANYKNLSINSKKMELNLELDALNSAYIESDKLSYLDVAQHLIDEFIRENPPHQEQTYVVSFDTLTSILTTVSLMEGVNNQSNVFTLEAREWLREHLNSDLPRLCCVIKFRDRATRFACFLVNTISFRHT